MSGFWSFDKGYTHQVFPSLFLHKIALESPKLAEYILSYIIKTKMQVDPEKVQSISDDKRIFETKRKAN